MEKLDHFAQWLQTPLGQYLRAAETAWFDRTVADIFGFRAVQLGLPELDALGQNRMPWQLRTGAGSGTGLRCESHRLPIESQSIDLLVLPHVLDFSPDPHTVLREAERVLLPEGRLLITGFNPWSLWGLRRLRASQGLAPWQGSNPIALQRLKDWLALLQLEPMGGEFLCYSLPVQRERWLSRTRFLELAGDRWWPAAGGVYCLDVIKRVKGMRVIEPQWRRVNETARSRATVAEKHFSELKDPN
jgi:SAM-dependent methyltransferase